MDNNKYILTNKEQENVERVFNMLLKNKKYFVKKYKKDAEKVMYGIAVKNATKSRKELLKFIQNFK